MKVIKFLPLFILFLLGVTIVNSQKQALINSSDSLTLAQAFINLSLTAKYFDSINSGRIVKILAYEKQQVTDIKKVKFIEKNHLLYHATNSIFFRIKARQFSKKHTNFTRSDLLELKFLLDTSITHFNAANIPSEYEYERIQNPFYELVEFNRDAIRELRGGIYDLRDTLTPKFNRDIYADFQRIFHTAKNEGKFYFDSLSYFAGLYNMMVDQYILSNETYTTEMYSYPEHLKINSSFNLALGLHIISKYLQFLYIAQTGKVKDSTTFNLYNLYDMWEYFKEAMDVDQSPFYTNDGVSIQDDFFKQEINKQTIDELYKLLQQKFPYNFERITHKEMNGAAGPSSEKYKRYYFPNPAPFPTSITYVNNFKPALRTMKQVDNYLKPVFSTAGYAGHLQYYYVKSGFALTTSLEKINKDGTPVTNNARWSVSKSGNGSLSFYQVFKSVFFETESQFRMFAFIVAPKKPDLQERPTSLAGMQEILDNSYPGLPKDIENSALDSKTLSILVYHFLQSDIGEVPMLETNNALPVKTHLTKSKLGALLVP